MNTLNLSIFQIGANNGNDHVYKFIKECNKEPKLIVLVEPIPFVVDELVHRYKDVKNVHIETIAITPHIEEVVKTLYYLKNTNYEVSSFDKHHVITHDPNKLYELAELQVNCKTLNFLFDKYKLEELDYLFIDTEGWDLPILESIDFKKYKIQNIIFEVTHSDGPFTMGKRYNSIIQKLKELGYIIKNIGISNIIATLDINVYPIYIWVPVHTDETG